MDKGEFIRRGFRCHPAVNGGWVLVSNAPDPGEISDRAAFTTFAEMIAWLQDQHQGLMEAKHPMQEVKSDEVILVDPKAAQPTIWYPCSFGCSDKAISTECYIHGASDA